MVWRSLGSFGINALDATRDTSQASDGRFFSWLNQLQSFVYVPRIGSIVVLRADAQWSPNHLPSLERFSGVLAQRGSWCHPDHGAACHAKGCK